MNQVYFFNAKFVSIGLFGKLQQVMQSEKERDTEFLKKLQMEANQNGEAFLLYIPFVHKAFLQTEIT